MFRGQLDGKGSFIIIVVIIFNSILDFNGSFSESNFHPVATARDAHLTGRHIRKAVAAEAKFYHLVAEIGVEICVNVDFGSFAGGVLNDQEDFGDQFDDVTRLQHQVALPPAAERR